MYNLILINIYTECNDWEQLSDNLLNIYDIIKENKL